ncbi:hypothetical protein DMN91_003858 [Ooceraea biroi]|uniref:Uncharacterized protein n=1 Tax=Ooceraea biroi TaxID=2015173 RepID=A0A3L8DTM3_OOCBI|nr:hypothetical protein DMN91_003858 [Ooceraea biroi]
MVPLRSPAWSMGERYSVVMDMEMHSREVTVPSESCLGIELCGRTPGECAPNFDEPVIYIRTDVGTSLQKRNSDPRVFIIQVDADK